MWVGKDEHEGVRAQPRKDLDPPPHWRLEAIAHTPRPRSLTLGADRTTAVFVQDADTSDVWLLDTTTGAAPERLTTGRPPDAVLGGRRRPPLARRRAGRLHATAGYVTSRRRRAARRASWSRAAARLDRRRSGWSIAVERDDKTTRLAVVDVDDPWPRRLARADGAKGDEGEPAVSPDGTEVAFTFTPRDDLNRSEIRVADARDRRDPRAHRHAGHARRHAGLVARRADRSPTSPSAAASTSCTSSARRQRRPAADHAGADHGEHDWHPDGDRLVAIRGRRNRFDLVEVDAATGETTVARRGRRAGARPHWTAAGEVLAAYEDHATPPELRLAPAAPATRPAPRAVRRAPPRGARGGHVPLLRRARDPRLPAAARAGDGAPVAAVVYPHGGPTDASGDFWDAPRAVLRRQGLRVARRRTSAARRATAATSSAPTTACGASTTRSDCLAAADFLRTLDWIDGDRLAIFGASYGSYMALLVGHRRPRAPLPLRRRQVRRLRHRHVLVAGRPRGRAGPRADDGPPGDRRARPTAPARRSTGSSSCRCRC